MSLPRLAPPQADSSALRWAEVCQSGGSDAELVRLAFVFWHDRVYRVARRILGDPWEAEEIVQEVYATFHRKVHRVEHPMQASAFLAKAAVRASIRRASRLRWRRRARELASLDAPRQAEPDQHATMLVSEVLAMLQAKERAAVVLRFVEGESLEEVAALMETSVSSVQRLLRGAREKIVAADQARFGELLRPTFGEGI